MPLLISLRSFAAEGIFSSAKLPDGNFYFASICWTTHPNLQEGKFKSPFNQNTKLKTGITASVPIAEITPAKRAFLPST